MNKHKTKVKEWSQIQNLTKGFKMNTNDFEMRYNLEQSIMKDKTEDLFRRFQFIAKTLQRVEKDKEINAKLKGTFFDSGINITKWN